MKLAAYIIALVAILFLFYRHTQNARQLLREWATANHYKILKVETGHIPPTSMWFASRYQVIYEVSLYDESAQRIRHAWVKLGTRYWGFMNGDAIAVEWKDERELVAPVTPRD